MRTYNLREVKPLRNLDPQHIDQMVALRGMVIRTSQIIPDLKQAFFRCIVCNASKEARCRLFVYRVQRFQGGTLALTLLPAGLRGLGFALRWYIMHVWLGRVGGGGE